jgi:hypothetical protein
MNNYTTSTSTPFAKGLITLGMLLAAGSTSFAAVGINATKTYDDLEMQAPASLSAKTPVQLVSGAGPLLYKFGFTIDNGCCMRVKAELMRQPVIFINKAGAPTPFGTATPIASKTFELCGGQANNSLFTNLSASQDDAEFFVQFTNLDSWDKAHLVIDHISVSFPTGVISLPTDPNTPLTLLQGQDQDRPFTVPDGKAGKLNISLAWTGGGKLKLEVFKPGASTPIQTVTSATGTLTVPDITVTTNDDGDWKLVYTNVSTANTPANSIATTINMTVNE